MNEANTAKDVLDKVLAEDQGKLRIGDREITSRVIEGDEEKQFWKNITDRRTTRPKRGKRQRDSSTDRNSSKRSKDESSYS